MQKNIFNPMNLVYIGVLVLVDFLVLLLSLKIAFFFRENYLQSIMPAFNTPNIQKYFWIVLISIILLYLEKIYTTRYDFWSDTKRVIKALFFSFVTVFTVITLTKMSLEYSRAFLLMFFFIAIFLIPFFKRLTKKVLFRFDIFKIKIKIVSKSSQFDVLYKEFMDNWYFGFKICDKKYDMVLISSKKFAVEDLQKLIKRYSKKTKDIFVIPYMYHLDFSHTNVVDYFNIRLSAIYIENRLLNSKNILIKYIFEKLLVILILPFALFLHLVLIVLIKNDSNGSVFFKQKRFGLKGKTFSCYKYRTMNTNGDEILKEYLAKNPDEVEYYNIYHKYKNDPRITKIGKFLRATSLDEFPQFFNILRGDMNLIGPRPYMLNEKIKIGRYNEDTILKVKPGITGLWQVSGRNELTFDERIDLDKWYIQNWSLWMDFVIFMKTIKVVLSKVGAR